MGIVGELCDVCRCGEWEFGKKGSLWRAGEGNGGRGDNPRKAPIRGGEKFMTFQWEMCLSGAAV